MQVKSFLGYILRSAIIGIIVAALILLLVPDLRKGSGLNFDWFSKEPEAPEKFSFYDALSKAAPAVVNLYSLSLENRGSLRNSAVERTSVGSGVIMSHDGYILTCHHVIRDADSILVGLQDRRIVEARIIGFDPYTDLAVLKVEAEDLQVIPQLADTNTRVGDLVMAIGNPLNLGQTITQGIVSRTGRNGLANYFDFIQMDASLHEGNSGGALIDSNGVLIGITNANFKTLDSRRRVQDVGGVSFAVPYELAKRVMDEIIVSGKVTRGQLGFVGSEYPGVPGILVSNVTQNGPAHRAGLRPNDVLLSINGTQVNGAAEALDMVAETQPGTVLTLEISRDKQRMTMDVTVAELGL